MKIKINTNQATSLLVHALYKAIHFKTISIKPSTIRTIANQVFSSLNVNIILNQYSKTKIIINKYSKKSILDIENKKAIDYKITNKTGIKMKKVKLCWRWFTISVLVLIALSVFLLSRPLDNTIMGEISLVLPFITVYYIIIGIHYLGVFEQKETETEKKEHYSFKAY